MHPLARHRARSSAMAFAVNATIGTVNPRRRSSSVAVYPSISGICMSMRIRSNGCAAARSTAMHPLSAIVTSAPAVLRCVESSRWLSRPSSASRMRPRSRISWCGLRPHRAGQFRFRQILDEVNPRAHAPLSIDTVKVLPFPSLIWRRCRRSAAATSRRLMVRPSPVPPKRRVVDSSACVNGWNSRSTSDCVMPIPLSTTPIRRKLHASDGSKLTHISMRPLSVNLIALPSRFTRIWRNLCTSV